MFSNAKGRARKEFSRSWDREFHHHASPQVVDGYEESSAVAAATAAAAAAAAGADPDGMDDIHRCAAAAAACMVTNNVATGGCPPHGMIAVVGRRREMEDAVSVVPSFCSIHPTRGEQLACDHHFFAVYDGHGGSEVADFCKERLHTAIVEEVKSCIGNVELEYRNGRLDFSQWKKIMLSAFQKIDEEIIGLCPEENCSKHKNDRDCKKPLGPDSVGSTAIIGIINETQIIVANCGDCRAVLSRGGKAYPMSIDHKPDREDELARVEAAGGRVIFWNGHRIFGVLAMSRALGDRFLKPFVIADPEVTCVERTLEDDFLILASDGLWDVLSNDAVCQVTRMCLAGKTLSGATAASAQVLARSSHHSRASFAAAFLTRLALTRGSADNISVVIIDLRSKATGAAGATVTMDPDGESANK